MRTKEDIVRDLARTRKLAPRRWGRVRAEASQHCALFAAVWAASRASLGLTALSTAAAVAQTLNRFRYAR